MYVDTKTFPKTLGLTVCFRDWRTRRRARFLHGGALTIAVTFEAMAVNSGGIAVDLNGVDALRDWIVETFDHKTLIASDDPALNVFEGLHDAGLIELVEVDSTSLLSLAAMIGERAEGWLVESGYEPTIRLRRVSVYDDATDSAGSWEPDHAAA